MNQSVSRWGAGVVCMALAAPAGAAVTGDRVIIETKSGETVEGEVIAETSRGLLIAAEGGNRLVPFEVFERVEVAPANEPAPGVDVAPAVDGAAPGLDVAAPMARPEVGGGSAIVTGWVLASLGGLIALSAVSERDQLGRGSGLVVSSLFVGTGAGCLIGGYHRRAEGEAAVEAWERRTGQRALSVGAAPMPGGGGAVLSMGF